MSNLGYDAKVVITFPSAVFKRIVSTVDSIMFILINIFNIQLRAHSLCSDFGVLTLCQVLC